LTTPKGVSFKEFWDGKIKPIIIIMKIGMRIKATSCIRSRVNALKSLMPMW
jgi:hypothetical protein